MVSLFKKRNSLPHCGGVLVNKNTILTAVHCVENTTANDLMAMIGSFGSLSLQNFWKTYSVRAITIHPDYKPCCTNDIAILNLTKPVVNESPLKSVKLAFPPYANISHGTKLNNVTAVILGRGGASKFQSFVQNFFAGFWLFKQVLLWIPHLQGLLQYPIKRGIVIEEYIKKKAKPKYNIYLLFVLLYFDNR